MAKAANPNMIVPINEKIGAFTLGLSQTENILNGVSPKSMLENEAWRIGETVTRPTSLSKTV